MPAERKHSVTVSLLAPMLGALLTLFVLGASGCGSAGDASKAASVASSPTTVAPQPTTASTASSAAIPPGSVFSKPDITTKAIPPGQPFRGDGDADNPSDFDGNGDADGKGQAGDADNDNPVPQSYFFPDRDDKPTFANGRRASASEARMLTSIVTRYYAAAAKADGASACTLLPPLLRRGVAESFGPGARPSYLRAGEPCPQAMSSIFRHHREQTAGPVHVIETRVMGDTAQAIIVSRKMPASTILLLRQSGRWRIEQMFGAALP